MAAVVKIAWQFVSWLSPESVGCRFLHTDAIFCKTIRMMSSCIRTYKEPTRFYTVPQVVLGASFSDPTFMILVCQASRFAESPSAGQNQGPLATLTKVIRSVGDGKG